MRLGDHPQSIIATTPRPIPVLKRIMGQPGTVITRGSTFENRSRPRVSSPSSSSLFFTADSINPLPARDGGKNKLRAHQTGAAGFVKRGAQCVGACPRGRPYELASVAGGWQHRTKKGFADAIRAAAGVGAGVRPLSRSESLVLMVIAYFQPIARGELSRFLGREVSRDLIGGLRAMGVIAAGPRSPRPGAPYAYVTTKTFLAQFGFDTLRDLPDIRCWRTPACSARTSCWPESFRTPSAAMATNATIPRTRPRPPSTGWTPDDPAPSPD
jgi:chromosome segregation and condensation protein ScpB